MKKGQYFNAEAFIREAEQTANGGQIERAREIVLACSAAINAAYESGYSDGMSGAERKAEHMNPEEVMEAAERDGAINRPYGKTREIDTAITKAINTAYQSGYSDGAADRKGGEHGGSL